MPFRARRVAVEYTWNITYRHLYVLLWYIGYNWVDSLESLRRLHVPQYMYVSISLRLTLEVVYFEKKYMR